MKSEVSSDPKLETGPTSSTLAPSSERDLTQPITVGAWNNLIRSADISLPKKAACLIVSSYADSDGTNIYCGIARLACDLRASYATAQRYLAWMREIKAIELVDHGSVRRGMSDEYRLILHPAMFKAIDIPNPGAYRQMIDDLRERNRSKSKQQHRRRDLTSPRMRSDDQPAEPTSDLTQDEVRSADLTSHARASDLILGEVPPTMSLTYPLDTSHEDRSVVSSRTRARDSIRASAPATFDGWCLVCASLGYAAVAQDSETGGTCDIHDQTSPASLLALDRVLRRTRKLQ